MNNYRLIHISILTQDKPAYEFDKYAMYDMIVSETMDGLKQPITAFCVGGGGSHLTRGSVAFNYINRTLSNYETMILLLTMFTVSPMTRLVLAFAHPQNNMKK